MSRRMVVCRRAVVLALAVVALAPAPALAGTGAHAAAAVPYAGIIASIFGSIGHALLGAFTWTVDLAGKFILTTLGALVRMLIPQSWVHKGLQIMQWLVAVPDYAGKIASPGGGRAYGFAGINDLREVMMWLGVAIAPLSLVYATARAMVDDADPVAIPVLRMLAVAVVIISYPYWWSQASALADQITNSILTLPEVSQGLYKLMSYAVGGVALGGWQLIDLALMGAIGLALLSLIFLKVAIILVGALLYATGPVMIGLVPTRVGSTLARAWGSAVAFVFALGMVWTLVFAVGALLIGDAGTAGPLIAGNSTFGSLAGGLLLAVAGLASLWLCLKAAREASSILRMQLSGMLILAGRHSSSSSSSRTTSARASGASLREYGSRLSRSARAAGGELAFAGAGGAAAATAARSATYLGRRGLVGTAVGGVRAAGQRAAGPATTVLTRSRAGAVAARMARAGTASWAAPITNPAASPPPPSRPGTPTQRQVGTSETARNGHHPTAGTSRPPRSSREGAPGADTARSRTDRSSKQAESDSGGQPRPSASPVAVPVRDQRSRPVIGPVAGPQPATAPDRRGAGSSAASSVPKGSASRSSATTPGAKTTSDADPTRKRAPRPAPTPAVGPQRPARPTAPKPPPRPPAPNRGQRPPAPNRSQPPRPAKRPAAPRAKRPEPPQRGER